MLAPSLLNEPKFKQPNSINTFFNSENNGYSKNNMFLNQSALDSVLFPLIAHDGIAMHKKVSAGETNVNLM